MSILAGLIGAAASCAVMVYVSARPLAAGAGHGGWHVLRPRPLIPGIMLVGAAMSALPSYVLMTGGSQRADAAQQNVALWCLAIGFALVTLLLGLSAYWTQVSWRDRRLRVRSPLRTAEYDFADIVGVRKIDHTEELKLTLRDGRRVKLTTYHRGLAEFEESLGRSGLGRFD